MGRRKLTGPDIFRVFIEKPMGFPEIRKTLRDLPVNKGIMDYHTCCAYAKDIRKNFEQLPYAHLEMYIDNVFSNDRDLLVQIYVGAFLSGYRNKLKINACLHLPGFNLRMDPDVKPIAFLVLLNFTLLRNKSYHITPKMLAKDIMMELRNLVDQKVKEILDTIDVPALETQVE